jgi:hypothetical protein
MEHTKAIALAAGNPGLIDGSSGTDSEDDKERNDAHKMAQIRHSLVAPKQPGMASLKGQ